MKNFTTAIILILFTVSIQSQKFYTHIDYRGDTTELKIIENPTVCDCENIDWRNKGQEKICNLSYDYDFMSEEEKKEYDKQLSICQYPSICDCSNVNEKNKGLLKACNRTYNYSSISKEQLERNIADLKKCPKIKNKELTICECINVDDYNLKQKCNETFFDDSLVSKEQRDENLIAMKKCILDKEYNLSVSTCDCARYEESDKEYKELCDEKIEKLKSNKRELTEYLYQLKICKESQLLTKYTENQNIPQVNLSYTVCKCNKTDLSEDEKEKCDSIWKFESMSIEEQKAYKNSLSRCK